MAKDWIVIPTYNERENIALLIPQIFEIAPHMSVLVVDDNSPDLTADTVDLLRNTFPKLFVLRRQKREGLGRAYAAGFKTVCGDPESKTVTMMDADLSHNPAHLPALHQAMQSCDLAIGSRYVRNGGVTREWAWWRRALSLGGNWYLRILARFPIHDWTTGYNVISTAALRNISLDALETQGYIFQFDLKYQLARAGAKIQEVPIFFEERRFGSSKLSSAIIAEAMIKPWRIIKRRG